MDRVTIDIDGAAEAAYEAAVTMNGPKPHEPWSSLPEYWKRIYLAQARAVIDHIDGQDPGQMLGQMSLFDGHKEDAA